MTMNASSIGTLAAACREIKLAGHVSQPNTTKNRHHGHRCYHT